MYTIKMGVIAHDDIDNMGFDIMTALTSPRCRSNEIVCGMFDAQ